MRNTVIWSFLSLVALATGGLITGCDSDDAVAKSAAGESCAKTSDCSDGLKCLQGTCYQSSSSGGSSNEGGDGNGGTVVGPVPPVLGGEGETCTKRADCEDGLSCISSRCTKDGGGEGGSGTSGPRLGAPGETCATTEDCVKGLSCIPGGYFGGLGSPSSGIGFVGVCTARSTAAPSGKLCGAECVEATDCCELPLELHVAYSPSAPYGTAAQSCSELKSLIGKTNCKTTVDPEMQARCFAQTAYCNCTDDTWSCDAGVCNYQADCTDDGSVPGGCPVYTRSGNLGASVPALPPYVATCNTDGKCAPPPSTVDPCKKDTDCDGADTADTLETCADGECGCYVETGACYRICNSTLDCPAANATTARPAYVCDEKTSFCTPAPACTTNEECAIQLGTSAAACNEGVCKRTCAIDFDCGTTAVTSTASLICGADHFCAPIGCSSDTQCSKVVGANTLHMFCTEPAAAPGTSGVVSAITD